MLYRELYEELRKTLDNDAVSYVNEDLNLKVLKRNLISETAEDLLNGSTKLKCEEHTEYFNPKDAGLFLYQNEDVDIRDFDIEVNRNFTYTVLQRADIDVAEDVLIFFHGLNEKKWDKYLPWAYELAQKTRKAVILFPIAFHMNRAEDTWSDRRKMLEVSRQRLENNPNNSDSSYVNAAISARLEAHPQRIFWSGFQTYSDTIKLVDVVRNGEIPSVSAQAKFDLFGYSIGSFLSMILMMANPKQIFTNSKLFCFCGGMTIDRMFPISKYIMDAQAAITMQKAFAELLSSDFRNDIRLGHFQNSELHQDESWFKKMLRYNFFQKEREERLKELQNQIKAFVLEKDEVAPPIEALNTLQGGYRKIKTEVEIADFNYDYSHMVPFPLTIKNEEEITKSFQQFVTSASDFYLKKV